MNKQYEIPDLEVTVMTVGEDIAVSSILEDVEPF